MNRLRSWLLVCLLGALTQTKAQSLKHSNIHIGLVYPLSTNGKDAKEYVNDLSIHAIAGLSAGENGAAIAGVANICYGTSTIQIAGFFNTANTSKAQVAGFINRANTSPVQLAGFINIAHKARIQIAGFINIADSCDFPIGFINIIRNGERSLSVSIDETRTTMVTFRSGGRHLYGILGAGYNGRNGQDLWAWEAGIGAHLLNFGSFRLKTEAVMIGMTDFKKGDYTRVAVRALPSYRLTNNIEVFIGASANYVHSEKLKGDRLVTHYQWSDRKANGTLNAGYFGYMAGLSIIL